MGSKLVQICTATVATKSGSVANLFALMDDGSLWTRTVIASGDHDLSPWVEIKPPPVGIRNE